MRIPDCMNGEGKRDFMCRTKHGKMFYCECCLYSEGFDPQCLSQSGTKGLKLDSAALSITETDFIQQPLIGDNDYQRKKNISTALEKCKSNKHKEFICTIYSDAPEKTYCVCTNFADNQVQEQYVFDTQEVWDPWKLKSIVGPIAKPSMLRFEMPTLFAIMLIVFVLMVIVLFVFLNSKKAQIKLLMRKILKRSERTGEKEKVL